MDEQVKAFIEKAKEQSAQNAQKERDNILISLGLTKGTRREYGPYGRPFLTWDSDEKKYYYDAPVPVEVTDEEFAEICKYIPKEVPEKEQVEPEEKPEFNNGAEKTLNTFNTTVLVICLIAAFISLVGAFLDEDWLLAGIGAALAVVSILTWSVIKVYINISNNLHEINGKMKQYLCYLCKTTPIGGAQNLGKPTGPAEMLAFFFSGKMDLIRYP